MDEDEYIVVKPNSCVRIHFIHESFGDLMVELDTKSVSGGCAINFNLPDHRVMSHVNIRRTDLAYLNPARQLHSVILVSQEKMNELNSERGDVVEDSPPQFRGAGQTTSEEPNTYNPRKSVQRDTSTPEQTRGQVGSRKTQGFVGNRKRFG